MILVTIVILVKREIMIMILVSFLILVKRKIRRNIVAVRIIEEKLL